MDSIITSPRLVRVTRPKRYALAGSYKRKEFPVTLTRADGSSEIIGAKPRKIGRTKTHKPARVRNARGETRKSTSLFDLEFRERLVASAGAEQVEKYL